MPRRPADGGKNAEKANNNAESGAFQVIVLGASGGPCEDNVTGLLVRSTATNWSKNSVVAVDAGVLMSGIARILDKHPTTEQQDGGISPTKGPFTGLSMPNMTSRANTAYIFREIISSVLITHPHLDHVSGLAMNTPAVEFQSGPKTVAGLPSAIAALKNHVFNDITWPNLSDEDGGAGMITYRRLVDGGNMRLGRGSAKGYLKVCEGLVTKCMSVSHGSCKQRYNPDTGKHHRAESTVFTEPFYVPSRRVSVDAGVSKGMSPMQFGNSGKDQSLSTVESSAFFIRDELSGSEILLFGDVEPDTVSIEPRNAKIWEAAAPKIASGVIRAIFIECSYPDSVEDEYLFGHLCPRHLIQELLVLAQKVSDVHKLLQVASAESQSRKRRASALGLPAESGLSPKSLRPRKPSRHPEFPPPASKSKSRSMGDAPTRASTQLSPLELESESTPYDQNSPAPILSHLQGLQVYIIHVKEAMMDDFCPREQILKELKAWAEDASLECEFYAPLTGESVLV